MPEDYAENTDREIWRKGEGDGNGMSYYEPSIHVTQRGDIGINVGGTVITLPVEEWHALAMAKFPGAVTNPVDPPSVSGTEITRDVG